MQTFQLTDSAIRTILICLIAINAMTFLMFGLDKRKSKRAKWRIPEILLIGMTALGGSIGAWIGMTVWHHKTMHKKFRYGIPLILIVQIGILVWLFSKNSL